MEIAKVLFYLATIDKFGSETSAETRLINILKPEQELLFDRFGNKL